MLLLATGCSGACKQQYHLVSSNYSSNEAAVASCRFATAAAGALAGPLMQHKQQQLGSWVMSMLGSRGGLVLHRE